MKQSEIQVGKTYIIKVPWDSNLRKVKVVKISNDIVKCRMLNMKIDGIDTYLLKDFADWAIEEVKIS